jgi:hypothetical protein
MLCTTLHEDRLLRPGSTHGRGSAGQPVHGGHMEGMITCVSVTWTEYADGGQQDRVYTVVPDTGKIRAERMEDLLDDLTLICEQLQEAQDANANGTASADFGRALRRIK